jgi:hypothetical protein
MMGSNHGYKSDGDNDDEVVNEVNKFVMIIFVNYPIESAYNGTSG